MPYIAYLCNRLGVFYNTCPILIKIVLIQLHLNSRIDENG